MLLLLAQVPVEDQRAHSVQRFLGRDIYVKASVAVPYVPAEAAEDTAPRIAAALLHLATSTACASPPALPAVVLDFVGHPSGVCTQVLALLRRHGVACPLVVDVGDVAFGELRQHL